MEVGDLATWVSSALAVVFAIVARRATKEADICQREAVELSKKNAELLEKQHQLELRTWTDQYFISVREWANEVACAASEAIHICDHLDVPRKLDIQIRLSALIDTGRWYFPNQWKDDYGTEKYPAYRGIRQPVLDCVVATYDLIGDASASKEQLVAVQREFVSHIQEALDPRKRDEEIKRILREFEQSERLRNAPASASKSVKPKA
ncbi:hypothetical protein [Variovorax sp. HJSM1_2]|uniref:hypothetical protein n=1 Tax=Variovorax sp. HJSM1_2 TaxID=3366263 RepID=UPI003BDACA26